VVPTDTPIGVVIVAGVLTCAGPMAPAEFSRVIRDHRSVAPLFVRPMRYNIPISGAIMRRQVPWPVIADAGELSRRVCELAARLLELRQGARATHG
jgi:hypothetical protein